MKRNVYEYPSSRMVHPPQSRPLFICPRRLSKIIFLCFLFFVSLLYLNSHADTGKVTGKNRTWKVVNTFHAVQREELSDTNVFIRFRGGRKGELTFRKNPLFTPSRCPTSLQHIMHNDSWTSSYYRPTIHMLMNSHLLNQSEYNRLRPYFMPFGYRTKSKFGYKDIINILRLFPAKNSIFNFSDRQEPQCITCGVVGNGGILNGSRKGDEIDSHHMVFRVNKAVRHGHEIDVGIRTTHYFFFDRSLRETSRGDVPNDEGMIYIFIPCRDNDYRYIRNVIRNKEAKINASSDSVRILHPDFIRYIHKVWVKSPSGAFRPTTGTIMLFTALFAGCDKVSVYGMGYNNNFTLYYYDTEFRLFKMSKASHDTKSELKILKGLDKIGAIEWYQRGISDFFH